MRGVRFATVAAMVLATAINAETSTPLSFRRDVTPLFEKECAYCHLKEEPAAGLVLESRYAYSMIFDAPSTQSSLKRVVPGNPDRSYLLLKMLNRHLEVGGSGSKMPMFPGGMGAGVLTARPEEIELVRTWIAQGALDN